MEEKLKQLLANHEHRMQNCGWGVGGTTFWRAELNSLKGFHNAVELMLDWGVKENDLDDGQPRCARCTEPMSADRKLVCEDCDELAKEGMEL